MTDLATPTRRGRPRSADPMEVVSIRMPKSLVAALEGRLWQLQQIKPDATRQSMIREAVEQYVTPKKRGSGKR